MTASASRACTHLLGRAGDQALMQPESLLLGETLSLVVPKQSTLDLSHAHKETAGETEVQMAGVYAAPCAGRETSSFAW